MKTIKYLAMAILATTASLSVLAQTYPSKTVKIMVGYAAGGAVDLIARSVGQSLQAQLGQNWQDSRPPSSSGHTSDPRLVPRYVSSDIPSHYLPATSPGRAGAGSQ